jgi:hypothetical protein
MPSIIERVVNIVSPSAKTVSRQQFFVALGLVALAQQGKGESFLRRSFHLAADMGG